MFPSPPADTRHEPRATEAQVLAMAVGDYVFDRLTGEWSRITKVYEPVRTGLYLVRGAALENNGGGDAIIGTHKPACCLRFAFQKDAA